MFRLPIVVGITGPPCAGKGVVKDYLLEEKFVFAY